jgi:hypothetical protein
MVEKFKGENDCIFLLWEARPRGEKRSFFTSLTTRAIRREGAPPTVTSFTFSLEI